MINSSVENLKTELPISERLAERMDDDGAEKIIKEKIDIDQICDRLKTIGGGYERGKKDVVNTLARLVLELKDKIPEYDTVISDDCSGRLPSLLLKKIIDKR